MAEKYIPCCDEHHIVRLDARLIGGAPGPGASVVFHDPTELDTLIVALQKLRENWDHPVGHIHIQDPQLAHGKQDPTLLEISFVTARWAHTEGERDIREQLVKDAHSFLTAKT
jgi:hypothetical protein